MQPVCLVLKPTYCVALSDILGSSAVANGQWQILCRWLRCIDYIRCHAFNVANDDPLSKVSMMLTLTFDPFTCVSATVLSVQRSPQRREEQPQPNVYTCITFDALMRATTIPIMVWSPVGIEPLSSACDWWDVNVLAITTRMITWLSPLNTLEQWKYLYCRHWIAIVALASASDFENLITFVVILIMTITTIHNNAWFVMAIVTD